MPLPQIISLISTVLLTAVALVVGVQLIFILKELRYSLTKLNQTIDTVLDTFDKIAQPALGILALLEGFKESGKIIETISRFFGRDKDKTANEDTYDDSI